MRTSALISLVAGTVLLTTFACGGGSDGGDGDGDGDGDNSSTGGVSSSSGGSGPGVGGSSTASGGSTGSGGSSGSGTYIEAADAGITVGIAAYDYKDTGGSTSTLTNPTPGQLCLSGSAIGHMMTAYTTNWGAGIGIALVPEADKLAGNGYDVTAATTIEFTLSGPTIPTELRVGLLQADDGSNGYFSTSVVEGANTLTFESLAQGDWVDPPGVKDFTNVTDLQFQVASGAADEAYDFCVSDIKIGDLTWGMGGAGSL